jgi:hypothetical protein
MLRVCCCSSPDCEMNGCILTRKRGEFSIPPVNIPVVPVQQPKEGVTVIPKFLTEEDVRRIIRSELEQWFSKDQFIK